MESKFDKQIRYKENQIIELNTKIEKWNADITQCLYSDITNDLKSLYITGLQTDKKKSTIKLIY